MRTELTVQYDILKKVVPILFWAVHAHILDLDLKKIHLVMLCSFIVLESFSRVHRVGFFGGCGGGCKKHTKPRVLDMYKKIKQMWAVPLLPDIWWRWVCWTVLCIPHDEIRRFSLHWYPHNWITKSGLKNPHQCTSIFDAKVKQRMVHILLFCSVLKLG